mmetsp:Transcript_42964/g.124248  ORF Transcript_42964/g.124248 Transcript_42964/m.124248 type:complete len:173 (+) Transcript_42964:129-647(+)
MAAVVSSRPLSTFNYLGAQPPQFGSPGDRATAALPTCVLLPTAPSLVEVPHPARSPPSSCSRVRAGALPLTNPDLHLPTHRGDLAAVCGSRSELKLPASQAPPAAEADARWSREQPKTDARLKSREASKEVPTYDGNLTACSTRPLGDDLERRSGSKDTAKKRKGKGVCLVC